MSDIQFLGDTQRGSALNSLSDRQQEARKPPQPEELKPSPFQGPVYFSPRIAIDRETANAVLQVRDTETGDILRQYPPDSAAQIYQTIQETGASELIPEAKIVEDAEAASKGQAVFGAAEEAAPEAQFGAAAPEPAAVEPKAAPEAPAAAAAPASSAPPSASLSATTQASSGLTGQSGQEEQRQSLDTSV